ncbi:hypothetical protein CH362_03530 [Leptospira saintgironsiae]|uniref:Uncharacterized protein n=1 Tax=Leptospira saintgironsiae TaxID=2023183 RepID=A0A2M9YH21_9LEPT|nr:hypothetical protein CH362_03530 [Leptospira saintgironsiae]
MPWKRNETVLTEGSKSNKVMPYFLNREFFRRSLCRILNSEPAPRFQYSLLFKRNPLFAGNRDKINGRSLKLFVSYGKKTVLFVVKRSLIA